MPVPLAQNSTRAVIISSLFVNVNRIYMKKNAYYWWLMQTSLAIVLKVLHIKTKVEGADRIPTNGRFLLVCNHRSVFDPMITLRVLKKYRVTFISKEENFQIPVVGRIIRRCNCLSINRGSSKQSLFIMQKAQAMIQSDLCSVGVYPEGTRSKDLTLLPFHEGTFFPAVRAKVPVVVCTIVGTENVGKNAPWHKTSVTLKVLEVIPASYTAEHRMADVSQRARSDMENDLIIKEADAS